MLEMHEIVGILDNGYHQIFKGPKEACIPCVLDTDFLDEEADNSDRRLPHLICA